MLYTGNSIFVYVLRCTDIYFIFVPRCLDIFRHAMYSQLTPVSVWYYDEKSGFCQAAPALMGWQEIKQTRL